MSLVGTCDVNTLHAVYSTALFHGFNQTAVRCVLVCERCVCIQTLMEFCFPL